MRPCPKCGAPCLGAHRFCAGCGADLQSAPPGQPNEVMTGMHIGGRFVLRELLGSGGMGKVYRADQLGVGRTVAVKIMHPHLLGDETAAARFTNEARASSQLNHPHSISVIDFGQTETAVLYMVMEYLSGQPLDLALRKEYPFPLGRVAHLMCQVMDAVHAAHKLNILHRDLKPENVFLLDRKSGLDFIKVLDFGIAKMLDYEDRSVTTPGLVPGTPEYMSPEQARGDRLDPRSDVYSLGVLLYELLTATVPFRGKSAVATMMAHVQDQPEPPSVRAPKRQIPPALEAIVLWALAKDPADRIESAQHFRELLSAWAQVAGVWPSTDPRASSPDVLLDFFSEDQLSHFREQVSGDRHPTVQNLHPVPAPRAHGLLCGRANATARITHFIEEGGPRAMRIQGARGFGKSRLVREIVSWARSSSLRVLHCQPAPGWVPPLLDIAHRIATFCLGVDLHDVSGDTLLGAATRISLDGEDVSGLKDLFGLPSHITHLDTPAKRRERNTAFRHLVYASAAKHPTLLVLEDIDRYDEPSRELVTALATEPRGQLSVIVTHLPDETQLWPPEVEVLDLGPLDEGASRELFSTLFSGEIDEGLISDALKAAGGCPLFLEQLAFAMHHDRLTRSPEQLAELIISRLDTLAEEQRRLLQSLSVVRETVSLAEIEQLSEQPIAPGVLDDLVARGLLRRDAVGYSLIHDLLAVVISASIPAAVRREMHRLTAETLRARKVDVAVTAYHAYRADDGPSAISELDAAGAEAVRCLDSSGAIRSYTSALELIRREWGRGRINADDLDRVAVDLARRIATVLNERGDTLTAEGVLSEVLSVAAGKDRYRASLRLEIGRLDMERGNRQRALRHLQLAQADAAAADDLHLLADVTRELARAHGLMGDPSTAAQLLHDALQLTTAPREPGTDSPLLQAAQICSQIGLTDRARGYLLDALQQGDGDRSPLDKLRILREMVAVHLSSKEWNEAELRIQQALSLAARVGDRTSRVDLLIDLGRVRRIASDVEGACKHLDEAILVGRVIGWWEGIKRAQREVEMLRFGAPQAP